MTYKRSFPLSAGVATLEPDLTNSAGDAGSALRWIDRCAGHSTAIS